MNKLLLAATLVLSSCSTASTPLVVRQGEAERATYEGSGKKFVVAAQGKVAAQAAKEMFEAGGNIIDAAVAASFVISVERPHSTGLGGGGFLLYREAATGKTYAIDFRERAPARATRDMYLDKNGEVIPSLSTKGIRSVAVPGLVAGLVESHQKFGKLSLSRVVEPAARLAEEGLEVYPGLAKALVSERENLARFPSSKEIFLKPDGAPYAVGEKIAQKNLARTIRLIGREGRTAFYQGPIAKEILAESKQRNGLLQQKDFDQYKVRWKEPLHGNYKGFDLYSMPPPSSGGLHVIEILNILERDPLRELGFLSAESVHRTASAMQLAFADRAEYLGDPDFVQVPVTSLLHKSYAARLRAKIKDRALPSNEIRPGLKSRDESFETTHFSIMDEAGNVVSSTQTINLYFGSALVAGNTGILLNDEMDDFSAKPGVANAFGAIGGDANAIAPGKAPLSSMSPTIVVQKGIPVMAVGAPGGTRIITCVAQTILNYLEYKLPIYEAVAAPRFHHQWQPDRIDFDAPGPGKKVLEALRAKGHQVKVEEEAVPCRVEAVVREGDLFRGAADPRDLGAVIGR